MNRKPLRTIASRLSAALLAGLVLVACEPDPVPDERLHAQMAKVDSARATVQAESDRLQVFLDSLDARIAQDVAAGMSPQQAEAIEKGRLEAQRNLLRIARNNLTAQEEFLGLLEQVRRSK